MPCSPTQTEENRKRREYILELHSQGLSCTSIGKLVGRARASISGYLRQLGLKTNPGFNKTVFVLEGDVIACKGCGQTLSTALFNTRVVNGHSYIDGKCRSCIQKRQTQLGRENILKGRVRGAVTRSEGMLCNITVPYLQYLYDLQMGLCFYTDEPLSLDAYGSHKAGGKRFWNALSLDKIEPDKGYVIGNVVLCTQRANSIKLDQTLEELRQWMPDWYARVQQFFNKQVQQAA